MSCDTMYAALEAMIYDGDYSDIPGIFADEPNGQRPRLLLRERRIARHERAVVRRDHYADLATCAGIPFTLLFRDERTRYDIDRFQTTGIPVRWHV